MEFLSAKEIAKQWGVSERTVRNYCVHDQIPGAFKTGKTWNIPASADKPARHHAKAPSPLLTSLREEQEAQLKGGIYHRVQIELAYNSNHIEGSRLSEEQTRLIFETHTIGFEDSDIRIDDIIETSNHFRAIDYIIHHAQQPLSQAMIKDLHRILKTATTDATKDWFAVGDYKLHPNEVGGRMTVEPEAVEPAIANILASYNKIAHPTLHDIIEFHVQFERIHPFQDGNGRVGRLIMFKECLANDVVPFIISDEMKRYYYRGLNEWHREPGFLTDTILTAQDRFKRYLDYFRILYK
ncbi:Fic family protein [Anaerotardibacter muris]|uniref:Fic family protein n=1 Tax=Anaerotardibacter muris TaxID=2941505 RepID=UPI00203E8E12|nr:DNA-binding protein [Anaerotardibacter muris]